MAKADQRKLIKLGIFLLLALSGVTILTTIYLLMLQMTASSTASANCAAAEAVEDRHAVRL